MRMTLLAAAVAAGSVGATAALALDKPADFPERPLTLIVPYGAGGGSDQLSRAWSTAMEPLIGQPFQVVNKPGGGGLAAVPDFMAAPKDGYTILQSIDDAVTNYASGRLDLNPAEDWEPICMTQVTFNQLYVRADDDRFADWDAFLAFAKENPGEVSIANVGNLGSMERVNMNLLESDLDFTTNQIAFDKPSERYASLIGGQVDALFEQPGDVRAFLDAGQIKPILTFFTERPGAFSEVPTVGEVGGTFEPLLRFRGFWTHPDVPEERKRFLEAACAEAFNADSFQEFNRSKFMELIDSYRDTEGARTLIGNSAAAYREVYKEIGLID